MQLTTHLLVVPRLGGSEAIPLLTLTPSCRGQGDNFSLFCIHTIFDMVSTLLLVAQELIEVLLGVNLFLRNASLHPCVRTKY
jgi:hypothetical protein